MEKNTFKDYSSLLPIKDDPKHFCQFSLHQSFFHAIFRSLVATAFLIKITTGELSWNQEANLQNNFPNLFQSKSPLIKCVNYMTISTWDFFILFCGKLRQYVIVKTLPNSMYKNEMIYGSSWFLYSRNGTNKKTQKCVNVFASFE